MATLKDIQELTASVSVEWKGMAVSVKVPVGMMNEAWEKELRKPLEPHEQFAHMIVGWDLEREILDKKGHPTGELEPLPITPETIRALPSPLVVAIVQAIQEDIYPNLTRMQNGSTSGVGAG